MFSPGIEPGTFCVLDRCDNHYTTKTWYQNCSKSSIYFREAKINQQMCLFFSLCEPKRSLQDFISLGDDASYNILNQLVKTMTALKKNSVYEKTVIPPESQNAKEFLPWFLFNLFLLSLSVIDSDLSFPNHRWFGDSSSYQRTQDKNRKLFIVNGISGLNFEKNLILVSVVSQLENNKTILNSF